MSIYGLTQTQDPPSKLLNEQHVFDIFFNDTSQPVLLPNSSDTMLPIDTPDTLLKLFQSINS